MCGVWGLGFGVWGLGFGVWDLGSTCVRACVGAFCSPDFKLAPRRMPCVMADMRPSGDTLNTASDMLRPMHI